MTLSISASHNSARLEATRAFADTGAANSRIDIYSGPQPAAGAAATGTLLVSVVLAKPCGTVAGGVLTLTQQDAGGDLIAQTGDAAWARWVNGADVWVGDGTVSDAAGAGDFKLAGTAGTTLYAGG